MKIVLADLFFMIFILVVGLFFCGLLLAGALFSWLLLITNRFQQAYFPLIVSPKNAYKAFFIQSVLFVLSAGIGFLRLQQIKVGHTDNVIENLIYGLSSLLLFRLLGDFKSFGVFAKDLPEPYAAIERRVYLPYFTILLLLSIALVV